MKKKVLAIVLTAALCSTCMTPVFASEGTDTAAENGAVNEISEDLSVEDAGLTEGIAAGYDVSETEDPADIYYADSDDEAEFITEDDAIGEDPASGDIFNEDISVPGSEEEIFEEAVSGEIESVTPSYDEEETDLQDVSEDRNLNAAEVSEKESGKKVPGDEKDAESEPEGQSGDSDIYIDESNFPDSVFRDYIREYCDTDGDDYLSEDEISAVTSMNLRYGEIVEYEIETLEGIGYFTSLKELDCSHQGLTELNLDGCYALEKLDCSYCTNLGSLIIDGGPDLHYLDCSYNKLTYLNMNQFTNLEYLDCSYNYDPGQGKKLGTLEVFGCPKLTELICTNNDLSELDVSSSSVLKKLDCAANKLESVDVEGDRRLTDLVCYNNQLTELNVNDCSGLITLICSNNRLETLDVSDCTELNFLNCGENNLTALDVSSCTELTELWCVANEGIGSLDVSSCTGLTELYCSGTGLDTLDVSACTGLKNLECGDNNLNELDVSMCPGLSGLVCPHNRISELDIRGCDGLVELRKTGTQYGPSKFLDFYSFSDNVNYNLSYDLTVNLITGEEIPVDDQHFPDEKFRAIVSEKYDTNKDYLLNMDEIDAVTSMILNEEDISKLNGIEYFTSLISLECQNNELEELDISGCPDLAYLDCRNNKILELDLRNCPELTELYCAENGMKTLIVIDRSKLTYLDCRNNQLSELDASGCTNLVVLYCAENELERLDVTGCPFLGELNCFGNKLTYLEVKYCPQLGFLMCSENNLRELDLSNCTELAVLLCWANENLNELDV
ncbi:MAG: leucine-rich repeat domain-containing protein, partial [Eubacterium sp.]|nr:leucine-rich repeat domain-containing protein [Eubacterium sp.]